MAVENLKDQFEARGTSVQTAAEIGLFNRWKIALLVMLLFATSGFCSREKDATQYGMGLIVNLPFPEAEVTQVVQEVIQNGIIRGTKEYAKDEYVTGATAVSSTRAFAEWTEGGKVFYKVRLKAIDPRNFKDGNDVGTLAVRYVVQAQDDKHTVLHIDARFVEDFRHIAHASDGTVESAEYKDIHDHLDSLELVKTETAEALRAKQETSTRTASVPLTDETSSSSATFAKASAQPVAPAETPAIGPSAPPAPPKTLEEQLHDLRQQVQRLVKAPGAPLKSAPFHTAATLQSLPAGTEVIIVISTTYWVGVETHEGQHGWILRDDLELVQ